MKPLSVLFASLLAAAALTGCGPAERPVPPPPDEQPIQSLKVLAVGNSFSDDALEYLYQIAADCGVTEIVLGNLFIAGCSLATHGNNAYSGAAAYEYRKNTDGTWITTPGKTLAEGIADEPWDFITLQQASGLSGVASSYDNGLELVLGCVRENKINPDAALGWHMTWAYQRGSNHPDFKTYQNDQNVMYRQIADAVKRKIGSREDITLVIPAGTAIQNVRSGFIGDTVTRDGYHLTLKTGRYIAGLTWAKALGLNIDDVTYVPDAAEITADKLAEIKRCVNAAHRAPYAVTPPEAE